MMLPTSIGILLLLLAAISVRAFTPLPLRHSSPISTRLHAEGKAPEYTAREVILKKAEPVGDGSAVLLHIDRLETDPEPFSYEPGHVLALEIEYNETRDTDVDAKTLKDAENNGGWMRAPYTVSTANQKHINVLVQKVGAKSKALAGAPNDTPLKLGGKFKVPIVRGISPNNVKRVCMISTGVGIGPCVGAVEKLLFQQYPYVTDLISSWRFPNEVIYKDYLTVWSEAYEGKFHFTPVVTDDVGRISASDDNIRKYVINKNFCSLTETHYHLIGNGQMVNEWKAGLEKAGVPNDKVTFEVYFNHKEEPSQEAVDRIATVIKEAALHPVK